MRLSIAFTALLVGILLAIGAGSYEDWHHETADEIFDRVMSDCKYMFDVGTAGGSETIEEFER